MFLVDETVLTAFLGDSDRNRTIVRQYTTMIAAPESGRRLLELVMAELSPAPLPIQQNCTYCSELTFYLTFPADVDDLLLNRVGFAKGSTI